MLPKLFSTLLHTLFWAIPAWIISPWAGAAVLGLGMVAFLFDSSRFTWLSRRRQGSIRGRLREIWELLGTVFYWAIGTAALSGIAWLIRWGLDAWLARAG